MLSWFSMFCWSANGWITDINDFWMCHSIYYHLTNRFNTNKYPRLFLEHYCQSVIPFDRSDHHIPPRYFYTRGISQSSHHRVVHSRCYCKLEKDMLEEILFGDLWDEIIITDDVNVCIEVFTFVMQHIANGCYDMYLLKGKKQVDLHCM